MNPGIGKGNEKLVFGVARMNILRWRMKESKGSNEESVTMIVWH